MRILERLGLVHGRAQHLDEARVEDWAPVPPAPPQQILGVPETVFAEGTGKMRRPAVPPPPPPAAMKPRK